MKLQLIMAAMVVLATGCSKQESLLVEKSANTDSFVVKANVVQEEETKTSLSGTALSWSGDDKIGVFAEGLQYNAVFYQYGVGQFEGHFIKRGESSANVSYVAYYPFQHNGYDNHTYQISGILPMQQTAPFDGKADFIVSDVITSLYDEETPLALNLTFANHLFSIIKITVTNSNSEMSDEKLLGVSVESEGTTLAGDFSFNVFNPTATLAFSGDPLRVDKKVSVNYPDNQRPALGLNTPHVLYAVVNSTNVSDIKLTFNTTAGVSSTTVSLNKTLKRGYITNLASIDVGVLPHSSPHHTVVLWGDSISTTNVTDKLSSLLGPSWTVVNGGIPGDVPISIAGRMGGAPMCLMDNITIPGNASESVNISGIYSMYGTNGQPTENPTIKVINSDYHYKADNHSLINNCTICNAECVIERNASTGQLSVHRAENGPDVLVTPKTILYTFGNTQYRSADVVLCYMGSNTGNWNNYAALANFYQCMIDYSTSKKFIVIGFHHTVAGSKSWSESYVDLFNSRFGNAFLDLRTVGATQGRKLLIETGVYSLESQISDLDISLMDSGAWPASWQVDYLTNVHPNAYGGKAIAIMAYEKMRSLGYLNE